MVSTPVGVLTLSIKGWEHPTDKKRVVARSKRMINSVRCLDMDTEKNVIIVRGFGTQIYRHRMSASGTDLLYCR